MFSRSLSSIVMVSFAALCVGLALPSTAHAQLFDFENQAATFAGVGARSGSLSSLTLTSGDVTLTITRPNATRFDIVNNTASGQTGKPASFGNRSLDPLFDPGNNGFIGNFSTALTGLRLITLDFGDYGGDADTLTLRAFSGLDGTGTQFTTSTANYGTASFPTFSTLAVAGINIRSITISGTSNSAGFNNSVFIDNINVTGAAGPEPASIALLVSMGCPAFVGSIAYRLSRRK